MPKDIIRTILAASLVACGQATPPPTSALECNKSTYPDIGVMTREFDFKLTQNPDDYCAFKLYVGPNRMIFLTADQASAYLLYIDRNEGPYSPIPGGTPLPKTGETATLDNVTLTKNGDNYHVVYIAPQPVEPPFQPFDWSVQGF